MTILERIESVVGTLQRYDGRYCIWATTGTHDIRDILYKLRGVSLADAMETLCEATEAESKRAKAAMQAQASAAVQPTEQES